jgi:hypothetical protein
MVVEATQVTLTIQRIFETIIYTICNIMLYRRQKTKSLNDSARHLSSQYVLAFFCWIIYMILDTIISLVIGLDISEEYLQSLAPTDFPLVLIGYDSGFPLVSISNFLRDIQMLFGLIMIIYFYYAANIIRRGTEQANEHMKNNYLRLFFILTIFIVIVFDSKQIVFKTPLSYSVSASWDSLSPIGWIGFFLYSGLMTYTSLIIIIVYIRSHKKLTKPENIRLLLFNIGSILLLMGVWYWVLIPLFQLVFSFSMDPFIKGLIGHLIWSAAPVCFFIGLKKR